MSLVLNNDIKLKKIKAIDFKTIISKGELNIKNKERSNLLPWKGQFSPQLVESLLCSYSRSDDVVLDPFMGSGTVLHECSRQRINSIGIELNPAAVKMAQIYLMSLHPKSSRRKFISSVESRILPKISETLSLFQNPRSEIQEPSFIELFDQIHSCYSKHLSKESRLIFETYLVLLDPKETKLTKNKALSLWKRLSSLVMGLPESKSEMCIYNGDCRSTFLSKNSIDLVITSPPYLNVFNYHQQKRFSIEALGWDVLSVARTEIGSNRKHRGNRYLTVIQYCLDICMVFEELHRVCKPKAQIIFVVGRESNIRKTAFYNSEIIANIAEMSLGFIVTGRYEREFKNRFGKIIKEDLLLIENPHRLLNGIGPGKIAHKVLLEAQKRAPEESRKDLQCAIDAIGKVAPSPDYKSIQIYSDVSAPSGAEERV